MFRSPVTMNPAARRAQWQRCAAARLPDIPPALRPQLYPGRDTNVVADAPADLLPHILDGPIEFVTLPNL